MLDPAKPTNLDLKDFSTYIAECIQLAQERLGRFSSPAEVEILEEELNRYPRLDALEEPKDIFILDESSIQGGEVDYAVDTLLHGGVLLEHACAGEATRLGLGTKYLINPRIDLSPKRLDELMDPGTELTVGQESLRPMTLGRRHMLQLAWDIWKLAQDYGKDPNQVIARQKLLIIVSEVAFRPIMTDFMEAGFYGFDRRNVLFMVQNAFHGIGCKSGKWYYDTSSPRRLHNHGQMLMQSTMDKQVFRLDEYGREHHLSWVEYRQILDEFEDKVSYNIEDLDYLYQSLDLEGLAAALKLSTQGARMVMEVVANNPSNPQKGGLCAWDSQLGRNVMIESFQLAGMSNERISFLNKNVNHYPRPVTALTKVRERGLPMPMTIKNGRLYFQPVQGDVNYLVPTAFLRRAQLKPISAWKSGNDTPAALEAMARQESRPGFLDWASKLTGLTF